MLFLLPAAGEHGPERSLFLFQCSARLPGAAFASCFGNILFTSRVFIVHHEAFSVLSERRDGRRDADASARSSRKASGSVRKKEKRNIQSSAQPVFWIHAMPSKEGVRKYFEFDLYKQW